MSTIKHSIGAILFLLILCGCVAFHKQRPDLPSDKSLITDFQRHQEDFDRLATMVNEDRDLGGVIGGQLLPADNRVSQKAFEDRFSEQRSNEYRILFSRLTADGDPSDTLFKRADGLFIFISLDFRHDSDEATTVEKGYAYMNAEPVPLVASLDEMGFDNSGLFYKRIDEHWYLYFESNDRKPK